MWEVKSEKLTDPLKIATIHWSIEVLLKDQSIGILGWLDLSGLWGSASSRFVLPEFKRFLGVSCFPLFVLFGCCHKVCIEISWNIFYGTFRLLPFGDDTPYHQLPPPYQSVTRTTPSLPGLVHGRLDSSSVIFKDLILWCSTGMYRIFMVFGGFLGSIWLPSISPLKVAGKMIFLFHTWNMLVPRRVIIHELHPYVNVSSRFLVSVLHVPTSVIDGRGYPLDGFLITSILQNLLANWSPSRKKPARDHKKRSISAYVFVHISKPSPSERVCLFRPGPGVMFTFVVLLFWPSWGEGQESRPWSCSADGPWSASLEMDLTLLLTWAACIRSLHPTP